MKKLLLIGQNLAHDEEINALAKQEGYRLSMAQGAVDGMAMNLYYSL